MKNIKLLLGSLVSLLLIIYFIFVIPVERSDFMNIPEQAYKESFIEHNLPFMKDSLRSEFGGQSIEILSSASEIILTAKPSYCFLSFSLRASIDGKERNVAVRGLHWFFGSYHWTTQE